MYSADTLPIPVTTYPSVFICNTDPKHLPGKHWIVFWFQDSHHSECYDSLGHLPRVYNLNFDYFFLQRNTLKCVYDNEPLQKDGADTSGYHFSFYLLKECRSLHLIKIVDQLKKSDSSDKFVVDYITQHLKRVIFILNQLYQDESGCSDAGALFGVISGYIS